MDPVFPLPTTRRVPGIKPDSIFPSGCARLPGSRPGEVGGSPLGLEIDTTHPFVWPEFRFPAKEHKAGGEVRGEKERRSHPSEPSTSPHSRGHFWLVGLRNWCIETTLFLHPWIFHLWRDATKFPPFEGLADGELSQPALLINPTGLSSRVVLFPTKAARFGPGG